jgi:hypothetical protein
MSRRRPLGNDLGSGAFERPAIGDHPRAYRLTSATTQAEVDDPLEDVVDFEDALVNCLHRMQPAPW